MKKKGLIISTIVMVVVLIASLTTATYAWFTADAQSKVTDIQVGVTTNAKVMIGVSKTNAFTASTAAEANFRNGTVSFDAEAASEKWSSGFNGLGSSINTGLAMNGLTKAAFPSSAGTGTDPKTYTVAGADTFAANMNNKWIKSEGESTELGLATQYEFAKANNYTDGTKKPGDYLDITFGVRAAQADINKIILVLGFENATETNLGMATALNYWYQVESTGTPSGLKDLYDNTEHTLHYDSALSAAEPQNPYTSAAWVQATDGLSWQPGTGDATVTIEIASAGAATAALSTTAIYQVRLIVFMNGWDSDCNNSAASVGIGDGSLLHLDFITIAKTSA